jgi:hypothetical protein
MSDPSLRRHQRQETPAGQAIKPARCRPVVYLLISSKHPQHAASRQLFRSSDETESEASSSFGPSFGPSFTASAPPRN